MADQDQTDGAAENTAASTTDSTSDTASGTDTSTQTDGPAPVFMVVNLTEVAASLLNTLDDADAKLKELAAAQPGVQFAILESRRLGEAPAPTVAETDVKTV